jgi:hypothetical protein
MTRSKLALATAAFGLVLAACGGGDSEATTTAPAPTEPAGTAASTAAPATTVAPDTAAPTTTAAPETTSGSGTGSAELAAFRSAIAETAEVTSAQMEATVSIAGAEGMPSDAPLELSFTGAFDSATDDFAFDVDLGSFMEAAGAAGEEIPPEFADLFSSFEIRQIGDTAYLKMAFFNMFLGIETEWVSMPADEAGSVGDLTGGVNPTEPTDFFAAFTDIEDVVVEEIGREQIRGIDTTHYLVTVDVAALQEKGDRETLEALELQGPIPTDELAVDFWIDDDGFTRKFAMDIDGADVEAPPGEGFESMTVSFEMFAFNEPITVEPPDPATVTNIEDVDPSGMFDFGTP